MADSRREYVAFEAHIGVLDANKWCCQSQAMWLTVVYMGANVGNIGAVGAPLAGGSGCRLVPSGSFIRPAQGLQWYSGMPLCVAAGRKP